jgi:Na+-translocating ferredoxin:NAD+ oxidoreductase RNF subunit RnfB
MTRRIVLTLADDTTGTECGECDYASCLPYAEPMIYVCTRPEFATRTPDGGYETAIRERRERVAACLAAEAAASRLVEIAPEDARAAIAVYDESCREAGATGEFPEWAPIVKALREHGRGR